jgi:hypothetical protein
LNSKNRMLNKDKMICHQLHLRKTHLSRKKRHQLHHPFQIQLQYQKQQIRKKLISKSSSMGKSMKEGSQDRMNESHLQLVEEVEVEEKLKEEAEWEA